MSFYPHTFEGALAHLDGARRKGKSRPVANNTYLVRTDEDTVQLVFHNTAIVTYHRDGSQYLFTGGWWTVTTKERINTYSAINAWGTGTYGEWSVGHTGEITEPDVRKCRARGGWGAVRPCRGTGLIQRWSRCYGPAGRHWHSSERPNNRCSGNQYCQGQRLDWPTDEATGRKLYQAAQIPIPCEHAIVDRHLLSRCEHDVDPQDGWRNGSHPVEPCEHGQWEPHTIGLVDEECTSCDGTGLVDYGSKRVPIIWDGGVLGINPDGTVMADHSVSAAFTQSKYYDWTAATEVYPPVAKVSKANSFGSEVATDLSRILPGLNDFATCPGCDPVKPPRNIQTVIIELNDKHDWSREQIADWLETLDVDLSFPSA